ncbi:MAG: tetratricopeptide repeat protein [Candidatus Muirbacterium halophilum]|nr:tetratricopeptide repeat protein [Candidatus Muirbacterium halophilum]MCK9474830.1 tetratricopeptide repeat protein [Candidatus Muirbacterium halophilum]
MKKVVLLMTLILILNISIFPNPLLKKHYSEFKDSLNSLKNKDFNQALSKIDNAIITAEKQNLVDSDILRYNRGIYNIMAGKPDNAIIDFEDALKNPVYDNNAKSKIYYNLGNSYLSKSDFKKALNSYIESYKINPNNDDLLKNMNYAVKMLKNPQSQNENGENDENKHKDQKDENKENSQKNSNEEKNKDEEEKYEQNQEGSEEPKDEENQSQQGDESKDEPKENHSVNEVIQLGNDQEKEAIKQYILKELDYKEEHNEKDW